MKGNCFSVACICLCLGACGTRDIGGTYRGTGGQSYAGGGSSNLGASATLNQENQKVSGTFNVSGVSGNFDNAHFDGETELSNVVVTVPNGQYAQVYSGNCTVSKESNPNLNCNLVSGTNSSTYPNGYNPYGGYSVSNLSVNLTRSN